MASIRFIVPFSFCRVPLLPFSILFVSPTSYLPFCLSDLVLLSPQDFLPLLRWQGDGLSPNKLVHLSIRASVEEVPAIMKLSGRLQLREWWREGEKDWIMALCARDREREQKWVAGVSIYAEKTCYGTENWDLPSVRCSDPWTTTHNLCPHVITSPAWILTQHHFLLICCFSSLALMNGWIHPYWLIHCMSRNPYTTR